MESTDSSTGSQQPQLPPGFRFHPTDEELVVHYLKKKASSAPLPVAIIAEVDLYKFDPWELPAKATFGEQEWYFFSPRDRKYPNGARPNRAATSGYWKATGTDKPVLSSGGSQKVGVKKALVFYGGKPPKGVKTNWIMHEYRLADNNKPTNKPPGCDLGNKKNSLRLDDWVLCRIYKKNNNHRPMEQEKEDTMDEFLGSINQQNVKLLHLPKTATNYNSHGLLEHDNTNLFEGIISHDHGTSSMSMSMSHLQSSSSKTELPLKRTLPALFWNIDEDVPGPSSSKRFNADNVNINDQESVGRADGSASMAALLAQLPQAHPLHQQAMLGALGDGDFRPAYQLPGMNWYA